MEEHLERIQRKINGCYFLLGDLPRVPVVRIDEPWLHNGEHNHIFGGEDREGNAVIYVSDSYKYVYTEDEENFLLAMMLLVPERSERINDRDDRPCAALQADCL